MTADENRRHARRSKMGLRRKEVKIMWLVTIAFALATLLGLLVVEAISDRSSSVSE